MTSEALTRGKATDLTIRVVSPEPSSEGARIREQQLTKRIIETVAAATTGRFERAVASGVQSFLEDHPGALVNLLKHGLPAEVLDSAEVKLTPAEQAKLADEIIGFVPEKPVRTTRSRKEKNESIHARKDLVL